MVCGRSLVLCFLEEQLEEEQEEDRVTRCPPLDVIKGKSRQDTETRVDMSTHLLPPSKLTALPLSPLCLLKVSDNHCLSLWAAVNGVSWCPPPFRCVFLYLPVCVYVYVLHTQRSCTQIRFPGRGLNSYKHNHRVSEHVKDLVLFMGRQGCGGGVHLRQHTECQVFCGLVVFSSMSVSSLWEMYNSSAAAAAAVWEETSRLSLVSQTSLLMLVMFDSEIIKTANESQKWMSGI